MQQMQATIMQAVRAHFRPEFLNRLDDILIFSQLSPEVMPAIVDIQLKHIQNLLRERQIQLDFTDDAKTLLAAEGFNPLYGARPLKRVIQSRLQDPLAEEILKGTIQEEQTVIVKAADGEFILQPDGSEDEYPDGQDAGQPTEDETPPPPAD